MKEEGSSKEKSRWPTGTTWQKRRRRNATGKDEEILVPYMRVRYVGLDGQMHSVWEQVENPAHARKVRKRLKQLIELEGEKGIEHAHDTFNDLADYYEATYLIEAKYVEGRKVAGRRSLTPPRSGLKELRSRLGRRTLRGLTHGDLKRLKADILAAPIEHKNRKGEVTSSRPRSIAIVNRILQLLRHMLNVAVREGWIPKNPFASGDTLISIADERKRMRVLSYEEEARLLDQCTGRRTHLRLVIIALVDTAMRAGEAFKLRVCDLNFDPRDIHIQAFNTKTLTERSAPITMRLAEELRLWLEAQRREPTDLVFGFHNVRTSFANARRCAGIKDLRLRDLRRTAATRLVRGGMKLEEVSRILGHTDIRMTYQYIGVDEKTTQRAADILDDLNQRAAEEEAARRRQNEGFIN